MLDFDKIKGLSNIPASPCYIFDEEILQNTLLQMRQMLPSCTSVCYAMKANPFLVPMANAYVDRFEVCSPGEYEICHARGIDPSKIIVSGVNKTEISMRRILGLSKGKGIYTIESPLHYEILSKLTQEMDLHINALIRLSSGNQFGVDRISFVNILEKMVNNSHFNFQGIHYFSGTQKRLKKTDKELLELNEFAGEIKQKFSLSQLELEFGPGLSVAYFADDKTPSAKEQLEHLNATLSSMNNFEKIGIEAGRFIGADCGYFLTSVVDLKTTEESNYAIVDGGIHQLHYYGQMMGMKLPPLHQLPERIGAQKTKYIICGSLCSVNDVLLRDVDLYDLSIGDTLIFGRCGAYSMTEGASLFLSRELPAIYEYTTHGELNLLREITQTYIFNTNQN